jgi:glycosyltransferase involved in cell wall biosynthesis
MSAAPLIEFVSRDPEPDVLVVTNMWPDDDWPVYGIFVRRQVDALRAVGIACDVLYIRGYRSKLAYVLSAALFFWWNLRPPTRYRIVHVHAGETALVSRLFVRRPMVVTFHGDDVMGDRRDDGSISRASRVRAFVIRAYSVLFRATIAQSQEMHNRLPALARSRNRVIPCGIDPAEFAPIGRSEARSAIGYEGPEHLVLFAATKPDIPRKRRWLAEAAVEHAFERVGPVELRVSGLTPPERMPLLMNAADCLLHTASFEGSPNVVREALMCDLPVVATPSGDLENLLEGVAPSRLCAPDAAELGDALAGVLATGTRSNGRALKCDQISSSAISSRLIALYESITPKSPLERRAPRTSP